MAFIARLWNWWRRDERGQGLAEYGLIIVFVAVVVVGAVSIFGDTLTGLFTRIAGQFSSP